MDERPIRIYWPTLIGAQLHSNFLHVNRSANVRMRPLSAQHSYILIIFLELILRTVGDFYDKTYIEEHNGN